MNKKSDAPVKKRLLEFLKDNNIEQATFCKEIGVADSILRKKELEISVRTLVQISTVYPQLSMDWLITGKGNRFKTIQNGSMLVNIGEVLELKETLIQEIKEGLAKDKKLIETQEKLIVVLEEGRRELIDIKTKPTQTKEVTKKESLPDEK